MVDIAAKELRTIEAFTEAYEGTDYDLFHIVAHEEYDHWAPHTVYLRLSRDPERLLPLSRLAQLRPPQSDMRRLLVLDVCDGGTAATLGGLHQPGVAQIVANTEQAVVSHLWPVHQLSLTTLGVLLARALKSGRGFFESSIAAAIAMRRPREATADELEAVLPAESESPRMLRNASIDFGNVHHWGSPVFLQ